MPNTIRPRPWTWLAALTLVACHGADEAPAASVEPIFESAAVDVEEEPTEGLFAPREQPRATAGLDEAAEEAEGEMAPTPSPASPVTQQGYADLALGGSAREAARPGRTRRRPTGRSTMTSAMSASAGPRAALAAPAQAALPRSGVLASTFVGGGGVRARLDDLLDRGVMVNGELVRLEAFQDREPLPYAVPSREGVAMYAELERAKLSTGRDRVHLQIALLGRQGEAPRRPEMDVRLVLDRSGSMQGEKWGHAIAAAHALVDRLAPGDTFGLISYAEEASLDLRPQRIGNRRAAHRAIDGLAPGGGTNIGEALALADAHAPRARSGERVGLVVLVSDGRATVGQTHPRELGATARGLFDRTGVLTTAIGLGTDFDEQTMLEIAREGSGSYHFVRRAADVSDILQDELEARVQAVAQALRVRVRLGEGVVARRVYGSRLLSQAEHAAVRATEGAPDRRIARELGVARTRQREEDEGLRIHLPTFRRGDQHVILMELEVPPGTATARVAEVELDYKDLVRRRNATITREVEAPRVADPAEAQASVSRVAKRTVLAFQAGEVLQRAADALQRGANDEARRLLAERRELLEAAADLWRDPSLRQDAELLARYERVLGGQWDGSSRNTLVMAMNYFGDKRMR